MNKKLKCFLVLIPILGTFIMLAVMLRKARSEGYYNNKIIMYTLLCGFVGAFVITVSVATMLLINSVYVDIMDFIIYYGVPISAVIGGYVMNLFTFLSVDKHLKTPS